MDLSRRRRALRALARGLTLVAGLIIVVLWAGAAQADEPTTGSITVVVDASPNDAHDFTFTGCQGATDCGPFTLDDDDDGTRSDRTPATDLAPGTYTITQAAVPNWAVAISCDSGETIDLPNRRATISLAAGEDVTCTFTNTSASITIVQDTSGNDGHDFTYSSCLGSGCGTFTLDDDNNDPTNPDRVSGAGMAPGTYTVTQAADTTWGVTSITCTTGETRSVPNRRVTITLTAGEQTTCTFSDRAASITIIQDASPNDARDFGYTSCLGPGCGTFTLDEDTDPTNPRSIKGERLAAGTYTITQGATTDWPLTEIDCATSESRDLPNRRVTIALVPGEQQTCTFVNTSAVLTLVEDTNPDSGQDFSLERCAGSDCVEVVLDDDFEDTRPGSTGTVPLPAGTYAVTAEEVDGYELASLTCATTEAVDLDARRVTITLAASEQQTCTFTHRPPPPHLTGVAQISAGRQGSCARLTNGQARCWGENSDSGQVGDGSFNDTLAPVEVLLPDGSGPLSDVADISMGFANTCAALTSGQARCWGNGSQGVLGTGTTTEARLPVEVSNSAGTGPLTDVVEVGTGGNLACALLATDQVACWGTNDVGQLGDGTTTTRLRPVAVSDSGGTGPLLDVAQLSVGGSRACALLESGEARCWGSNMNGGLGDGTTTNRSRPVPVSNVEGTGPLTDITQVTSGWSQSCALLESGEGRCWGSNSKGQLGDGTTTNSSRPVVVSNAEGTGPLTGIVQLSVHDARTCALVASGSVYCWGDNASGALGDGTTTDRLRPTLVSDVAGGGTLTDVAQVPAGLSHACALLTDGEARCWGGSGPGALGDGTSTPRRRPVAVIDPLAELEPISDVAEISAGAIHTCARLDGGGASCWGSNSWGQLGTADVNSSSVPVAVSNSAVDGPLAGVIDVSAGRFHTCAVLSGGTASCWGNNDSRRLCDGTSTHRRRPVTVLNEEGTGPLTGVEQVSAGYMHTCAVLADTTARCWGLTTSSAFPVAVTNETGTGALSGVAQISTGEQWSCAALTNGQVRCWGDPEMAAITVSNPEGAGPLTGATQVALAYDHACALLTSGEVACWSGTGATSPNLPRIIRNQTDTGPLTDATSLAAGGYRTCAGLVDGTAVCWGDGPIGDGTYSSRPLPTPVAGVAGVSGATVGMLHSCVALDDGQARCWGFNEDGQVGNGSVTESQTGFPGPLRPTVVRVPIAP